MATKKKPTFSKRAFWSDDFEALDPDKHADHMISRVFDAGTYEDMAEAIRYYGKEKIKEALTASIDLQSSTVAHAAIWLELHPLDFQATTRKLINPQPYTAGF